MLVLRTLAGFSPFPEYLVVVVSVRKTWSVRVRVCVLGSPLASVHAMAARVGDSVWSSTSAATATQVVTPEEKLQDPDGAGGLPMAVPTGIASRSAVPSRAPVMKRRVSRGNVARALIRQSMPTTVLTSQGC